MPEQVKKTPCCTALLAHVDAGKTTLSEALLYLSGARRTLGRVDHKDAFLKLAFEKEKKISQVRVTFDPSAAQWNDKVLGNIILPDEFRMDYYNCDDDDVEEKKLIEAAQKTKPAYILIKREYGKDIHYAV